MGSPVRLRTNTDPDAAALRLAAQNFNTLIRTGGVTIVSHAFDGPYLAAVAEGWLPLSPEGYETFWSDFRAYPKDPQLVDYVEWLIAANTVRIELANGMLSAAYSPASGTIPQVGRADPPDGAAVGRQFNQRIRDKVATGLFRNTAERVVGTYVPPSSSAQATPAPPPAPLKPVVMWVVSKDPASGYGASGDGIHFPTVGYRIGYQRSSGVYDHFGPWVRYSTVVNRTSSAITSVTFLEDIRSEVTNALAFGDKRPSDFWDWPALQSMLTARQGPPPDPTIPVDVYAAPSSTSAKPATLPAGSAPPDVPPVIAPPTPSGKPWTDVAVPPPPTIAEQPTVPGSNRPTVDTSKPGGAGDVPGDVATPVGAGPSSSSPVTGARPPAAQETPGATIGAGPGPALAVLAILALVALLARGGGSS